MNEKEWITASEAAKILGRGRKRPLAPRYVFERYKAGKIRSKMLDGRTRGYLREDVENYGTVKEYATPQE